MKMYGSYDRHCQDIAEWERQWFPYEVMDDKLQSDCMAALDAVKNDDERSRRDGHKKENIS